MEAMTEEALREAIRRLAADGKVPCKSLLDLVQKSGASPKTIGRLCDEMNLRICACQLGCFK